MTVKHTPFHNRVFTLEENEFNMSGTSLDDWLSTELDQGYLPTSMVALPSDNYHLRVTTEYQPEKAKKHPARV